MGLRRLLKNPMALFVAAPARQSQHVEIEMPG
jgi:hypothetical protein